ncbi:hypothetical protein QI141_09350 [Staphylococcus saprophyticus]|nr:hypothetical protein [Staphylococcus saprophyticus]
MSDLMNSDWERELQSMIGKIDPKDVKKVLNDSNKSYEETNNDSKVRNKNEYSMNLNDIIKFEVELIYYNNVTSSTDINKSLESKPDKWEDDDLFLSTKTNFSANFRKFCDYLGINPDNFKNGKSFAFKPKSKYVIHDILSNNSDYVHFLKYGANEKDLGHMNKISENLFYFIKNEITDPTDYETALTNYYLYFLVNSNVEIGIKSKIVDIITAPDINNGQKLNILEYYLSELTELNDEINSKLAEYQSYDYNQYLNHETRVQIDINLAKYMTNKETKSSAPKDLILKLLTNSELVAQPKFTKEHRNKLISKLKKALNYHLNESDDYSEFFYITTK